MSDAAQPPGFEAQIKPMFSERDRESMQLAFDLWSYDDVSQHADAILARLQEGTMPCDGVWPRAQLDLFQRLGRRRQTAMTGVESEREVEIRLPIRG